MNASAPHDRFLRDGPAAPLARHSFRCALCDKEAGTVMLFGPPEDATMLRETFLGPMEVVVDARAFAKLRRAINTGDIKALHRYDLETASFYCPTCKACYCGDHWTRWDEFDDDGWHDCVRGHCPRGHERMLQD